MSENSSVLAGLTRRRRNQRRWLIVGTAVLVLLIGSGIAVAQLRKPATSVAAADTTVLERSTLRNTVSATGTVASASTTKVYSTLPYAVTDIYVSVGSVVAAGDKLLDLDKATISKQMTIKEASLDQASAVSSAALKSAQDSYNAAAAALANGTNSAVVGAQAQVTSAYSAWQRAKQAYANYKATLSDGLDPGVLKAQQAADGAWAALVAACTLLGDNSKCNPADPLASTDANVKDEQAAYSAADEALNAALNATDNQLADLKLAADAANKAYTSAQAALDAARAGAQSQLQALKNAVNSAKAQGAQGASLADLATLRTDLASTTILAPAAGTVTAIYAKVGANGAGLTMVIEDVNRLVIDSTVKEFDVNTLTIGMAVTIASDATREDVYEGRLSAIDPAAAKDPTGETLTTGDIVYGTKIDVTSPQTRLRIGMSVRISYVVDSQDGLLAVPIDAVFTNTAGAKVVLIAVKQNDGKYVLQELPVTTGLENDLAVAVSGPGVNEGIRVLNAPAKLKAGTVVTLTGAS